MVIPTACSVVIRETGIDDLDRLSAIVDEEWKFSTFSESNGMGLSKLYLLHCMKDMRCLTLTVDGIPEGVVMFEDGRGHDALEDCDELSSLLEETKGYDAFMDDLNTFRGTYKEFESSFKEEDLAELRLIIISKNHRNRGLGIRLLDMVREELSGTDKEGLFFYSDTDCNTGFYDRIGAERLDSKDVTSMGRMVRMFAYRLLF